MKKLVYEFGLIFFYLISLMEMAPALLHDQKLSDWEFAGVTMTVLLSIFSGYKFITLKNTSISTQSA